MRIAKAIHLERLLQTQDALLSALVYAWIVLLAWLVDYLSLQSARDHHLLLPMVVLFAIVASFVSRPKLHGEVTRTLLRYVAGYVGIVLMGMLALIYFGRLYFVNRALIAVFAGGLAVVLLVNRLFLQWWYLRGRREQVYNYQKVLIVGTGQRARRLAEAYIGHSEWGVSIVGMLDPDPARVGEQVNGIPVIGTPANIDRILATEVIDEVIVCLPRGLLKDAESIVAACEEEAVVLKVMADVYDVNAVTVSLERVGDLPLLSFEPVSHGAGTLVVKRVIDLLVAITLLVVLAPLFAVVAVAIKRDSPGPVFFRQERVGLNKRIFKMIKFRSMYVDAESRLGEIEHLNEASGPIFKIKDDPRVTRVGRLLRRTSIDELPQLINVLLGQMSLIGPRPMSKRDVRLFSLGVQRKRFSVRPGLACLREVSGRSKLSFERWLELDLQYIENWSLWLDFKIMLLLIPVVLKGDGAS